MVGWWWAIGLIACGKAQDTAAPAPVEVPITVGGDRPAEVIAPADWDGVEPLPVLLLLHGYGATGPVQNALLGFSDRVEPDRFVLILPDGTTDADGLQFWNGTDWCCDFGGTEVDDVGYLVGLIDELDAAVAVDRQRVYSTGHSNGGFMSYRLACDRPDVFAAIAPLAGMTWLDDAMCASDRGVSVLHIHGDADETVLYEGAAGMPSAPGSAALWAARDGCDATPAAAGALDLVDGVPGEETQIEAWSGCDPGLAVELWTMEDEGHVPFVNDRYAESVVAWLLEHPRP
jgi:polyhydroxybutyrate depolymerase